VVIAGVVPLAPVEPDAPLTPLTSVPPGNVGEVIDGELLHAKSHALSTIDGPAAVI
jgi:hypothetical protein